VPVFLICSGFAGSGLQFSPLTDGNPVPMLRLRFSPLSGW